MASLRGRFFTSVIKKYFSINPEVCKDPVAKLQRLNKNSVYGGPKGFNKRVIPLENAAIEMYECKKNQNKFLVYYLHGGAYIQNLSDLYRLRIRKYSRIARNADVALSITASPPNTCSLPPSKTPSTAGRNLSTRDIYPRISLWEAIPPAETWLSRCASN